MLLALKVQSQSHRKVSPLGAVALCNLRHSLLLGSEGLSSQSSARLVLVHRRRSRNGGRAPEDFTLDYILISPITTETNPLHTVHSYEFSGQGECCSNQLISSAPRLSYYHSIHIQCYIPQRNPYLIPNTLPIPTFTHPFTLQPQHVPAFLLILIVPFMGGTILLPIHIFGGRCAIGSTS